MWNWTPKLGLPLASAAVLLMAGEDTDKTFQGTDGRIQSYWEDTITIAGKWSRRYQGKDQALDIPLVFKLGNTKVEVRHGGKPGPCPVKTVQSFPEMKAFLETLCIDLERVDYSLTFSGKYDKFYTLDSIILKDPLQGAARDTSVKGSGAIGSMSPQGLAVTFKAAIAKRWDPGRSASENPPAADDPYLIVSMNDTSLKVVPGPGTQVNYKPVTTLPELQAALNKLKGPKGKPQGIREIQCHGLVGKPYVLDKLTTAE